MAINEDTTTWIALPISFAQFERYNLEQTDYDTLLAQAGTRAKNYILNTLKIPQEILDSVDGANVDDFQLAYQQLACSEFLKNNIGLFGNTLPFKKYESPEDEIVEQDDDALNRWLSLAGRLRSQALTILKNYIEDPSNNAIPLPSGYNWS